MSLFLVTMDVTIVNVALPALREHLKASMAQLQWSIDAYTVVLGSLLILAGSTADRFGRKKIFMLGLSIFSLGSLLCGFASSAAMLIAFRMLQAIGGAMLNPVAMSIITNTFKKGKERAKAIGVWGAVVGISMSVGPMLGGVLTEHVSWRAIFWINVPIGVLAFALTLIFVPESKADKPRAFDFKGESLAIIALGTVVTALIEGEHLGWTSFGTIALFASFAISVSALVFVELRTREPMIDMRYFKSVKFSCANLIAVFAFMGMSGFLFLNSLYLQETLHFSPTQTGLCLLPTAVMMIICSPLSGRLVANGHVRACVWAAGFAYVAGGFLILRGQVDREMPVLLISFGLIGAANGLINTPITNTAVSGLPDSEAGVAAAIASTSRQVGSALGVAIAGTLLAQKHTSLFWWMTAASGLIICAFGWISTTERAERAEALKT